MNFGRLKPKYKDKAKLCYMDPDSIVINIFTEDFSEDIDNNVERWFDTSNYRQNDKRPLPMGTNKKVIRMFKNELGRKIMKEFCALRAKTYAYLMDDDIEKKKAKGIKKCVIKHRLMFENYKDSLFNNKTILKSQLGQQLCTQKKSIKFHLVVMMIRDCKHLIELKHPYGTNAVKACESEVVSKMCLKY